MVKYFSHFSTVGQRVPGGGGCVAGLVWLVYSVAGVWPVWCGWCVASIVWLVCDWYGVAGVWPENCSKYFLCSHNCSLSRT